MAYIADADGSAHPIDADGYTELHDADGNIFGGTLAADRYVDELGNYLVEVNGDYLVEISGEPAAPFLIVFGDRVLDGGLTKLDTEASRVYLCSDLPLDYTEATATFALGFKDLGAGNVFGAPAADSHPGRHVVSAPLSGGSITVNGTAAAWAAV